MRESVGTDPALCSFISGSLISERFISCNKERRIRRLRKESLWKMDRTVRTLYLIRQVQLHCRSHMDEALNTFDLTASEYTILSILDRRDRLSAAQLSRRFSVTPQSMNALIGSLEEKGLISRREAPQNRRILQTTLTRSGRALLAACDGAIDAAEAELFCKLTKAELGAFRQVLRKLATQHNKAPVLA